MRLIYLYIEKFNKLKSAELNFCSDYLISKSEEDEASVSFDVHYHRRLAQAFFSPASNRPCIDSVSCLVGENGVCKTSVAQLFYELMRKRKNKPKALVVLEVGGEIEIYSTLGKIIHTKLVQEGDGDLTKVREMWEKSVVKSIGCDEFHFPFAFIYHSPYYTTESQMGEVKGAFLNFSTSGLLRCDSESAQKLTAAGLNLLQAFDFEEKRRAWQFLARYSAEKMSCNWNEGLSRAVSDMSVAYPSAVSIKLLDEVFAEAVSHLNYVVAETRAQENGVQRVVRKRLKRDPAELDDEIGEFLRSAMRGFERYEECDYVGKAFLSFIAVRWQNGNLLKRKSVSVADELLKEEILSSTAITAASVYDFLTKHIETFGYDYKCFCLLDELVRMFGITEGEVRCEIGDEQVREKVLEFVSRLKVTAKDGDFISVDIYPKLSSGEMSFLSLFGRLYEALDKAEVGANVVLFLDEAETTLHPNLQRKLVLVVTSFLTAFFPGKHVQLVFASHSPLLLSDVPIGNVVFLHKDAETECVKVSDVRDEYFQNTFAANIYDLFRLPFFMEEGVIGAFACKRLNEILMRQKEKKDKRIPLEERTLVSLVGDQALRKYLLSREPNA